VAQVVGTTEGADWMVQIARGLRARGYDVCAIVSGTEGRLIDKLDGQEIPWHSTALLPGAPQPGPVLNWLVHLASEESPLESGNARGLAGLAASILSHARFRALARPFIAAETLGRVMQLARLLRRERIDIVHGHIFPILLLSRAASWLARTPVRVSMISGPYHLDAPKLRRLDRRSLWMDHCTIASCDYIDHIYATMGVPSERRARIYYGSSPETFTPGGPGRARVRAELGVRDETPLIGLVAYFYPPVDGPLAPPRLRGEAVKGHEYFVDAAQIVLERHPEARFVMVGNGWGPIGEEYKHRIEQRCRIRGIEGSVIFAGHRTDIPDVLAAFDVSVQCSLSESLGGTIESLLMERPTIATAVGGMPEAVRHEETGLLVPPRDSEALAEAMLRFLDDRALGDDLGRAGRRLMLERFTIERTVADIDELYRRLGRAPAAAPAPVLA
jgi:glycosyltransferase involved in cell wall biosynthesis